MKNYQKSNLKEEDIKGDSILLGECYYKNKDTEEDLASGNATYVIPYIKFLEYCEAQQNQTYREAKRKNEMFDKKIVYRTHHFIAGEEKQGTWAHKLLERIGEVLLDKDLSSFSKKEKQNLIAERLKEEYTEETYKKLLEYAEMIDRGDYIVETKSKRFKYIPQDEKLVPNGSTPSDDTEVR